MTAKITILFALLGFLALCNGTYYVDENGKACIVMDITATIEVLYTMTNGTRNAVLVQLPNDLLVYDGECMDVAGTIRDYPAAEINITLPDKSTLNVTFVEVVEQMGGENVTFTALDRVIYSFDTIDNPAYINPANPGRHTYTADGMTINLHRKDHFYYCDEDLLFGLDTDVLLTMHTLRLQAINVINNTYSGEGDKCLVPTTIPTTPHTTTATEESNTTITETTTHITTSEYTTDTTEPTNITTTESMNTTTSESMNTTTSESTNSTTEMPTTASPETTNTTSNTTGESESTTMVTQPSTTTEPEENFFFVMDSEGNVCLIMQFNATFKITYNTAANGNKQIDIPFNPLGADSNGTCGDAQQSIIVSWKPLTQPQKFSAWTLSIFLFKVNSVSNDNAYTVQNVTTKFLLDSVTFPGLAPGDEGKWITSAASSDMKDRFRTAVGDTYRCKADEKIVADNGLELDTNNFKIEAFRKSKDTDFSKNENVCTEDNPVSPKSSVVPIIIGVVLALLVVAVLIAYFIGRRRAQNNSYQQLP